MGYKENKKYIKRCLYGLYVFIYMPWFFTLEHFIQPDMPGIHILNTPLDDKIPFCEYFIIPYILWFFYVVGSCIFMIYKASDKEFVQFALSLIIGMSLALTICMIYPNGLTLRPSYIPDNICGKIVKGLYKTDHPLMYFRVFMYTIRLLYTLHLQNVKHLKINRQSDMHLLFFAF